MAEFLEKRKRSREVDIACESMPLTKRINNLHINHDDGNSSSSSSCSMSGGGATVASGPGGPDTAGNGVAGGYEYNPELGAEQNPFYYEKNKMLYNLHVERIKRSNQ